MAPLWVQCTWCWAWRARWDNYEQTYLCASCTAKAARRRKFATVQRLTRLVDQT